MNCAQGAAALLWIVHDHVGMIIEHAAAIGHALPATLRHEEDNDDTKWTQDLHRMVAGVKRMWEFCGVRVQGGGVGARQLPLGQGCPGDAPRVMDDNTCHAMPITRR